MGTNRTQRRARGAPALSHSSWATFAAMNKSTTSTTTPRQNGGTPGSRLTACRGQPPQVPPLLSGLVAAVLSQAGVPAAP